MDASLGSIIDVNTALATYQRGSKPIDTILATSGVRVTQAGYLPFGEGVGDHRPLYVDIEIVLVLRTHLSQVTSAAGRRLKLQDPRVVKKYNSVLEIYLQKHRVKERSTCLQH